MKSYLILIFTIIFISAKLPAQVISRKSVDKLNEYGIPFIQEDLNSDTRFQQFNSSLNNKKIIALGESSHGTGEFFSAKDKLIRYLVEHQNVKTVALETDFCGMESINNFVLNKYPDSIHKEIEFTGLYGLYGVYRTYEVYDLAQWLRNHNKSLPDDQKVILTGADMQDPYYISISLLNDSKNFPFDQPSIATLNKLKEGFRGKSPNKFSKEDKILYKNLIMNLNTVADNFKSNKDFDITKRHIRLLEQSLSLFGIPFSKFQELRDKYFAENVLWLSHNNKIDGTKTVLWAHNSHISFSPQSKLKRCGSYLKDSLGTAYYALALSFNEGDVSIQDFASKRQFKAFHYSASEKKDAIEYFLNSSIQDNYILNFTDLGQEKELKEEIKAHQYMRVIGAEYLKDERSIYFKVPVLDNFDGILFMRSTTAARNLPRTR